MSIFSKHPPAKPQPTILGFSVRGRGVMVPEAVGTIRPDSRPDVQGVNAGGRLTFTLPVTVPQPQWGLHLTITALGYQPYVLDFSTHQKPDHSWDIDLVPATAAQPGRKTFSKAQICELQGDLMLYCQAVSLDGTGIKTVAPGGQVARGLEAGWHWTLTIWRYAKEQRERLYQEAISRGWTHWAIQVVAEPAGDGYHGLFPISPEQVAAYGETMNVIHRELLEHGLIPLASGVAPGVPVAPGFDVNQVLVAQSDWDNNGSRAARVKAVHDTFPHAWVFVERPGPSALIEPEPGPEDPIAPTPGNGGSWIRLMKQRCPRFVGVLYEVNNPDGLDTCQDELVRCHAWYRDLLECLFEPDTYYKFWYALEADSARLFNDELKRRLPWLHGCMGGWTMHAPPPDEDPGEVIVGTSQGDQIDPASIVCVDQSDMLAWPITTSLSRLELRLTGIHAEFDKRDQPGRWPDVRVPGWDGDVSYSMGLVLKVNGQWYASAPIECWHDRDEAGGGIQQRAVEGTAIGQIPKNWFYDNRWGALAGYQPQAGEELGFFVASGSIRNRVFTVKERSNIVVVPLPADGVPQVFEWR